MLRSGWALVFSLLLTEGTGNGLLVTVWWGIHVTLKPLSSMSWGKTWNSPLSTDSVRVQSEKLMHLSYWHVRCTFVSNH